MFTGIIREIGAVRAMTGSGRIHRLTVASTSVIATTVIGDSVAVDGVCLTVVEKKSAALVFDVMDETVRRSTIGTFRAGRPVNLERALGAGEAMGGHFVLGHVDSVGTVRTFARWGDTCRLEVAFEPAWAHLVVEKGSVALDGISLTVGAVSPDSCTVHLIPHTLGETTLHLKKTGDAVNIEFDIIGKYLARFRDVAAGGRVTEQFLRDMKFI